MSPARQHKQQQPAGGNVVVVQQRQCRSTRSAITAVVIVVLSSRHCTSIADGQAKLKLMMDKQHQQQMSTMIPDEDG